MSKKTAGEVLAAKQALTSPTPPTAPDSVCAPGAMAFLLYRRPRLDSSEWHTSRWCQEEDMLTKLSRLFGTAPWDEKVAADRRKRDRRARAGRLARPRRLRAVESLEIRELLSGDFVPLSRAAGNQAIMSAVADAPVIWGVEHDGELFSIASPAINAGDAPGEVKSYGKLKLDQTDGKP